jgi:hypothetical protein
MIVHPQWGTATILQPFPNFEQVYQGQPAVNPVAFPGTIDQQAANGVVGFDSTLIAGTPVVLGARLMLWIPLCMLDYTVPTVYRYQLVWRLRSISDFQYTAEKNQSTGDPAMPYHLQRRELGVFNTPGDAASQRIVVPAASDSLAYEQQEPASNGDNGEVVVRGEWIVPNGALWDAPITPSGELGTVTQGIFPLASGDTPGGPVYFPYWVDAKGDELIILARRREVAPDDEWEFSGADRSFSNTFGTDNGSRPRLQTVGIFLFAGSS